MSRLAEASRFTLGFRTSEAPEPLLHSFLLPSPLAKGRVLRALSSLD